MGSVITFDKGTVSTVSGSEIPTSISVTVTGSIAGIGTLTVTTAGGVATKSLTVTTTVATITSYSTNTIYLGALTNITLQGFNLGSSTVSYSKGTCGSVVNNSATGLTIPVTGTSVGTGNITVTSGGSSVLVSVTVVTYLAPTITSITNNKLSVGDTSKTLVIKGTNFISPELLINTRGVSYSYVVDSATQITVTYTIPTNALIGSTQLTVRNSMGYVGISLTIGRYYPIFDYKSNRIPNPSKPITDGIQFSTIITAFDSGVEQRRKKGAPRRTWEFNYVALLGTAYQTIADFFLNRGGPLESFQWVHPLSNLQYTVRFNMDSLSGEYFEHTPNKGPVYKLAIKLIEVL